MQGLRHFSAHLTSCHACHGICTLSPLDAALPMRFAKKRNTTRLKCCACHAKWRWTCPKCCACHENCNASLKTSQKYCACHTKPCSTRYKTRLNVTKCHACHAKRSNEKFETSKHDHLCKTYHRHGHTVLTRTVADGCGRLRTVAATNATSSEHTLSPETPRVKREPLLHLGIVTWRRKPAVRYWGCFIIWCTNGLPHCTRF